MPIEIDERTGKVAQFVSRLEALFGIGDNGAREREEAEHFRYVIYARKSTDASEKQERSIPDQIRECQALTERLGLRADIIHEEKSAKVSDKREKFSLMLADIVRGKYQGIVAWSPDRLARNMKEGGEIIDLLDKGVIRDLRFANNFVFSNDPSGKMLLGIGFVMAKQYSDQHGQNVARASRRITLEGRTASGIAKHGYYKDKDKFLRPDGENWQLIKQAFEMRLSRNPKHSLEEIVSWLRQQGYPRRSAHAKERRIKINVKFISDLFRDPFYAGAHVYGSQIVNLLEKYDFEPIVTPEEFDSITKGNHINRHLKLSEVIHPRGQVKAALMRGMVLCAACGRALSVGITPKKLPTGTKHYYYFRCDTRGCRFRGKSVRAKVVLAAAFEYLNSHPMAHQRGYELYVKQAERGQKRREAELDNELRSLQARHRHIEDRIQQSKGLLVSMKGEESLVREFRRDLERQIAERERLVEQIRAFRDKKAHSREAIKTYQEFIELFGKLSENLQKIKTMTALDENLRKLFMNFTVEGRKVAQITLNSPFKELSETSDSEMVAPGRIELPFRP